MEIILILCFVLLLIVKINKNLLLLFSYWIYVLKFLEIKLNFYEKLIENVLEDLDLKDLLKKMYKLKFLFYKEWGNNYD